MGTRAMRVAVGIVASVLAGDSIAQQVEEVVVQATRIPTTKTVGRSVTGVPIVEISLSYGVSYSGLDLASSAGASEIEKRVTRAAKSACKEIGHQFPGATPSDAECARVAADKAMVKVHELVSAAQKSAGK